MDCGVEVKATFDESGGRSSELCLFIAAKLCLDVGNQMEPLSPL